MAVAPYICSKDDFIGWNGEDPRLLSFIDACEREGYHVRYTRGNRYSYMDVVAPNGSPITACGYDHTLTFDGDNDTVTLLGCSDMDEGMGKLRGYMGHTEEVRLTAEINSLRHI